MSKHIYETNEGVEHTFDTYDEMIAFGIRHSWTKLVAEGLGEIVISRGKRNF